jgi:hypothetical protein
MPWRIFVKKVRKDEHHDFSKRMDLHRCGTADFWQG